MGTKTIATVLKVLAVPHGPQPHRPSCPVVHQISHHCFLILDHCPAVLGQRPAPNSLPRLLHRLFCEEGDRGPPPLALRIISAVAPPCSIPCWLVHVHVSDP